MPFEGAADDEGADDGCGAGDCDPLKGPLLIPNVMPPPPGTIPELRISGDGPARCEDEVGRGAPKDGGIAVDWENNDSGADGTVAVGFGGAPFARNEKKSLGVLLCDGEAGASTPKSKSIRSCFPLNLATCKLNDILDKQKADPGAGEGSE